MKFLLVSGQAVGRAAVKAPAAGGGRACQPHKMSLPLKYWLPALPRLGEKTFGFEAALERFELLIQQARADELQFLDI